MISGGRGGYCFEQNMLFRGGLRSLGYKVTSLQARVVRGLEIDAPRPMLHMVLRVDLPRGSFLADVPTAPLRLSRVIAVLLAMVRYLTLNRHSSCALPQSRLCY